MFSDNELYIEDINHILSTVSDWNSLSDKTFFITGATGLIGTVLVDALMHANNSHNCNIEIIALTRNIENAKNHFSLYANNSQLKFLQGDVVNKIEVNEPIDYIINLASNTHPGLYSAQPINTIEAIISGTKNILDLAVEKNTKRVINASSVEIYGENRGDVERFTEDYCGYINCNTLRAGYSEGKRLAESLNQAYIAEKGIDVVSARIARSYGPTVLRSDRKAITQFMFNAVNKEDIILKSDGVQRFSYIYVTDVVTAILTLLLRAKAGEAYNISNDEVKKLCEIADILARLGEKRVVVDKQVVEGASVVQVALMDSEKMKRLNWAARYDFEKGLYRTVEIIRSKYVG